MLQNLLHEDKALKKVAHTPKDQKPRFEWSAIAAGVTGSAPTAIKVKVGGDERDFDMGEIADTIGSALTDLLLARQNDQDIYNDQNRRLVLTILTAVLEEIQQQAGAQAGA
ncbi:MAG TPA: hypothetical protein DIT13_00830, partial [Verrucomicrobiales bacterium]|nr:hypothetical protein [Verrucomicrobiales bacterium]